LLHSLLSFISNKTSASKNKITTPKQKLRLNFNQCVSLGIYCHTVQQIRLQQVRSHTLESALSLPPVRLVLNSFQSFFLMLSMGIERFSATGQRITRKSNLRKFPLFHDKKVLLKML